ncbi:MAG: hypothetical protein N4A74_26090 [Carboxylicivirga sp.]|jgi:hypothetical protein|nr:hypothetical protein [Carboxylicivirga sp.]
MKEVWEFYIMLFSDEIIAVRIITYSASLATLTFLITYVIKPLYKIIFQKRNILAERKLIKYAKQIEKDKNRAKYLGIENISEVLNISHDEVRDIITRSPKFKKIHSTQELWVRKKSIHT